MELKHLFFIMNVLFTTINLWLVFRNVRETRRLVAATQKAQELQAALNNERERIQHRAALNVAAG